jgi:hypothetical protein
MAAVDQARDEGFDQGGFAGADRAADADTGDVGGHEGAFL